MQQQQRLRNLTKTNRNRIIQRNTNEYQEEYFIESGTVNNNGHGKNGTGCA